MPDENGTSLGPYKYLHERIEIPQSISPEIDQHDEPQNFEDQLQSLFHEILVYTHSLEQRAVDLKEIEQLILSCSEFERLKPWTPTMLRLSKRCPFEIVKTRMKEILLKLQDKCRSAVPKDKSDLNKSGKRRKLSGQTNIIPYAMVTAPSAFVLEPIIEFNFRDQLRMQLDQVDGNEDFRKNLDSQERKQVALLEHWRAFHRIDHLAMIMSMHVSYFELFRRFMSVLLMEPDNSGLIKIERIYIAIMAAAARQSSYLIHFLSFEFINDPSYTNCTDKKYEKWLENGLESMPTKFQSLAKLNEKLASRPWAVNSDDIIEITMKESEYWRDSDLTYAIVIMSWFHALAGFCHGVGINPELDAREGHTFRPPSTNSDDSDGWDEKESSTEDVQFLHEKMESLMKKERIRTESQSRGDFNEEEDRKVRLEYFDKLRKDCESDSRDSTPTFVSDDDTDEEIMKDHDSIFYKFLTLESRNGQFMTRQKTEHKTAKNSDAAYLLLQDYNWRSGATSRCPENAYETIHEMVAGSNSDLAPLMDEKFEHTRNLTYKTIGNKTIEGTKIDSTQIFRHGIWDYTNCLMGIMSEEVAYHNIEALFDSEWREYLRDLVILPTKVTKKQYDHFCPVLCHDEKVHVNILCLEARFQAELLYAMRALGLAQRHI